MIVVTIDCSLRSSLLLFETESNTCRGSEVRISKAFVRFLFDRFRSTSRTSLKSIAGFVGL